MGWAGGSSSTTTTKVPSWVRDLVQEGVQEARDVTSKPFTPYADPRVAGADPMQSTARDMATQSAGAWAPALQSAQGLTAAGATAGVRDVAPRNVHVMQPRPAAQASATGVTPVANATGATAAPGINSYVNPWTQQVTDQALSAIRKSADKAHANLGQNLASQHAFGGSREAIMRAELEKSAMEESAKAAATYGAEGFKTAADLAAGDAGRATDASLFNAGAANTAQESAAGRATSTSQFNTGQKNDLTSLFATLGLDASKANAANSLVAQQANQGADMAGADRLLAGGAQMGDLAKTGAGLATNDINIFNTLGAQGQQTSQAQLDANYEEFMREQGYDRENLQLLLSAINGSNLNMFTSQQTKSNDGGAGMLGALGSLAQGGAMLFSDRRLKRDAAPLGVDANGLTWWRYAYVWDRPGVTRIGVMADEAPDRAVARHQRGFAMVDYAAL